MSPTLTRADLQGYPPAHVDAVLARQAERARAAGAPAASTAAPARPAPRAKPAPRKAAAYKPARRTDRETARDVRAWAASAGMKCPARGRIPATVLAAYEQAH